MLLVQISLKKVFSTWILTLWQLSHPTYPHKREKGFKDDDDDDDERERERWGFLWWSQFLFCRLLGSYRSRGHQVYRCIGNGSGGSNYTLDHAIARLYTSSKVGGPSIGRHYFQPFPDGGGGRPTWALFDAQGNPSTTVTGVVKKTVPRPGTIPDLLLQATSHSGVNGAADAAYVIRKESIGGSPPGGFGCNETGLLLSVPYQAWYRLYAMNWKNMAAGDGSRRMIKVPDGVMPLFRYFGQGEQIYTFNGSAWVQKNVSAVLYPLPGGGATGRHFYLAAPDSLGGQPSWETFNPGSFVTAKVMKKVVVDGDNIPWLLLATTSQRNMTGSLGLKINYVQRAYTRGGMSPKSNVGAKIGDIYASPYTAVYWFYSSQPN